jgi:hypothetical protein
VRADVAKRYNPIDLDQLSIANTPQFLYENLVSSVPYMIPGLLTGGVGGLAARGIGLGARGIAAAGQAGYVAGTVPTFTGSMASRQAEEQNIPLAQVDWGKALAAGTAATALDLVTPNVLGLFGRLASRVKAGDKVATEMR